MISKYELRFVAFTRTNLCSLFNCVCGFCVRHLLVEIYLFADDANCISMYGGPTSEDDHVSLQMRLQEWSDSGY